MEEGSRVPGGSRKRIPLLWPSFANPISCCVNLVSTVKKELFSRRIFHFSHFFFLCLFLVPLLFAGRSTAPWDIIQSIIYWLILVLADPLFRCGQSSASDYVEVSNFMSVDRKLPRYCGQLKELKMESDAEFFRVSFKSNDRFDGTGFFAHYQFSTVADAGT